MSSRAADLSRLTIDRTHGGTGAGLIDFSASLNPLGPPPEAIAAYHRAADRLALYPAPYPRALEARIASWIDVAPGAVLAGNGSTQLIYLIARELRLRCAAVVIPTFSEIGNSLIGAGSQPVAVPTRSERDFRLDPAAIDTVLEVGSDGIFLGRPNSPTGQLIAFEEIREIAARCARRDAWCVIDEAFIEFADDPRSAADLICSMPKVIVLRSLTKIFALAGLRIGYAVAHPQLIGRLRDSIEPWSVNTAAEAAASACLDVAQDWIARTRRLVISERCRIETALAASARIRPIPSSANFVMAQVAEDAPGDFARHLQSRGLAARDLSALPGCGAGFYRFGVRMPADNDVLCRAIAEY